MAMRPTLFRPPVRFLPTVSGLYGRPDDRSAELTTDMNRRLGVVGLKLLIAMIYTASKNSIDFSPGRRVT